MQTLRKEILSLKLKIYQHQIASMSCLHAGGTVNADDLSVDPFTVLGCEEADDAGDIDWLADTSHW